MQNRDSIVVLLEERVSDTTTRKFHCVKCGKCICEIVGNAHMIIPGEPTERDLKNIDKRVVIQCRGMVEKEGRKLYPCNAKYYF